MAIITYPLNGITYTAEDAETYLCTRTSGVFSSDGHFAIEVTGDRQVTISPGLAWINNGDYTGKSVVNTEPVVLDMPIADGALPRIDRIVLRFNKAANETTIMLLAGTPASVPAAPTISRTELLYDLALYDIMVSAASVSIKYGDITSRLLDENLCGLMRDGVTGIPTALIQTQTEELLNKLRGDADTLMAELRDDAEKLLSDTENSTTALISDVRSDTQALITSTESAASKLITDTQNETDALTASVEAELKALEDNSAVLLKSGGTMTGELVLNVPLGVESGGIGGNTPASGRQALDVYSKAEVDSKVDGVSIPVDSTVNASSNNPVSSKAVYNYAQPKLTIDSSVSSSSNNPVSGKAVAAYAFAKTMMVQTTTDPGANKTSSYPDGTRIDVYE